MFVIGDVHGCLKTLKALVAKLPTQDPEEICLVGDLIDRGPDSVGVVDYVMEQGFYCVRANHEDMMLAHFRDPRATTAYAGWGGLSCWEQNGGEPNAGWTQAHRDWMAGLPFYIHFADEVRPDGRALFVSHGCPHPYKVERGELSGKRIPIWDPYMLMWERQPPSTDINRYFVYGHTPQRAADVNDQYANVDTGCVHQHTNITPWGKLTALQFPELVLWEQEFVDFPEEQTRVETVKTRPL